MLRRPLFTRGVTLLGGHWISDVEGFVDALAGGKPSGSHGRKFALPREEYPGVTALLDRLA